MEKNKRKCYHLPHISVYSRLHVIFVYHSCDMRYKDIYLLDFNVLIAVTMKSTIFCVVTKCGLVEIHRFFTKFVTWNTKIPWYVRTIMIHRKAHATLEGNEFWFISKCVFVSIDHNRSNIHGWTSLICIKSSHKISEFTICKCIRHKVKYTASLFESCYTASCIILYGSFQ
jgi:hypothetical protein